MEPLTSTPPAGRSKGPAAWIKKNKAAAGAIGVGGIFIFLTQRGRGEDGGAQIVDAEGELTDASTVQLVPVTSPPVEGTFEEEGFQDAIDKLAEDVGNLGLDVADLKNPGKENDPKPSTPNQGITVHGKFFKGATRFHHKGGGEFLIYYPGRIETWYLRNGKWSKTRDTSQGPGANVRETVGPAQVVNTPPKQPQGQRYNPPGASTAPRFVRSPTAGAPKNGVNTGVPANKPRPKAPQGYHMIVYKGKWWRVKNA